MFTDQELRVLRLLVDGASNRRVANELGVSVRTIETRRHDAMEKLGAVSAVQLGYLFALWDAQSQVAATT